MEEKSPVCTPVIFKMPVRSDSIALFMVAEEAEAQYDAGTTYEICTLTKSATRSSLAIQTSNDTSGTASILPYFHNAKNDILYPFVLHCLREEGRAALYYKEQLKFKIHPDLISTCNTVVKSNPLPCLVSTAHVFTPVEHIESDNEDYFLQRVIMGENLQESYDFSADVSKLLGMLNRDVIYPTQFLALKMDFIYDKKDKLFQRDIDGEKASSEDLRKGWEILMLEPRKVTPIGHLNSLEQTVRTLSELEGNFISSHVEEDRMLSEANAKNTTHYSHFSKKAYIYDHLLLNN